MKNKRTILAIGPAILLLGTLSSCQRKENKQFTVTFETNGGTAISSVKVNEGEKVKRPSIIPLKEKSHFTNWHVGEGELSPTFNFNTPITGNTTIYAQYIYNDKEATKTEWENEFGKINFFDTKTNFTLTLAPSTTENVEYTVKKDGNKVTFAGNDGETKKYLIIDNHLWGLTSIPSTEYFTYHEPNTAGDNEELPLVEAKNGITEALNGYYKATTTGDESSDYIMLGKSFSNLNVSFSSANPGDPKTFGDSSFQVDGYRVTYSNIDSTSISEVFPEESKIIDNRIKDFTYKNNGWYLNNPVETIDSGTTVYFAIDINKEIKGTTYLTLSANNEAISTDDANVTLYTDNVYLGEGVGEKYYELTSQCVYSNSLFVIKIEAKNELSNINVSLKKTVNTKNDSNDIDEEVFYKYMDDSTLYALGFGKISGAEMDAIARQPEAEGKIRGVADLARNFITEYSCNGMQAVGIGKIGAQSCDAIARQPEAEGKIRESECLNCDYIVKNDSAVAPGIGKVGGNAADAIARQPEASGKLMYAMQTLFGPSILSSGDFDKALAIGKIGAQCMDATARQPEASGKLYVSAKLAIEELLNS